MFYAENEFLFHVHNLEGYQVVRYLKQIEMKIGDLNATVSLTYDAVSCWSNLMRWIESMWRLDEANYMLVPLCRFDADVEATPMYVAYKLFEVADGLEKSGLDWTAAKRILQSVSGLMQAMTDENKALFKQDE